MLPVYLDHVLYPTLTDSGFVTEVHHVTGTGENAGVVYCEMQGRENSDQSLLMRALVRDHARSCVLRACDTRTAAEPEHLPGGERLPRGDGVRQSSARASARMRVCTHASRSRARSGIMANLRSLTADTVRKYHRDYYRPENLCVIVSGDVEPEAIFAAMQVIEDRAAEDKRAPHVRCVVRSRARARMCARAHAWCARSPWSRKESPLASNKHVVRGVPPAHPRALRLSWRPTEPRVR